MASTKDVELTAESQSYIDYTNQLKPLNLGQPLDAIRAANEEVAAKHRGDYVFNGTKEEMLVSGEQYQVPVTILRPQGTKESPKCIVIYFHGGGWVWSSRTTHMKLCEMISQESNCVVVNVEYRLSPEHKFPACYVDAEAVVRWCLDNKKKLSGSDSALVGVAGDSAGANISASVCHLVNGLAFQILIYASVDLAERTVYASYNKYCEGYLLNSTLMSWFMKQFLNSADNAKDPLCSPILRESFTGLPPALFIVSEIDPLADQSSAYKKKLDDSGVKTQYELLKGTVHGFVSKPGHFKATTARTVQLVSDYLSQL